MNQKPKIKLGVVIGFIFVYLFWFGYLSGGAEAVACNGIPIDGCTVNNYTIFTAGTYQINGTPSTGAITINGANAILDCDGARLNGNFSGRGIFFGTNNNITVKNCILNNYSIAIRGAFFNSTAINNTIYNSTSQSLYADGKDGYIINNTIYMRQSGGSQFINGVFLNFARNMTIRGNTIYGSYFQIHSYFSNLTLIDFNTVINSTQNGIMVDRAYNNTVFNNTVNNPLHNCIDINNDFNNVSNNYVTNCIHYGIDLNPASFDGNFGRGTEIFNNTIDGGSTCGGIIITQMNDTIVSYNTIRDLNFSGDGDCSVVAGIQASSNLSGFTGLNNYFYNNTITNISEYCIFTGSINASWEDNKLANCSKSTIYIQNLIAGEISENIFLNNVLLDNYSYYQTDKGNKAMNFTVTEITSNYSLINFTNNATMTFSYGGLKRFKVINNNISIYNLSNALMYNLNMSIFLCSDINNCDGDFNYSNQVLNTTYILENFNVTESYQRQFSPVWFDQASLTSSSKNIRSNLTQDINATVSFNVTNCQIEKIEYKSNTSKYLRTYTPNSDEFICSNAIVQISNVSIEPANESNIFSIIYIQSSGTGSGGGGDGITNQSNQTQSQINNQSQQQDNNLTDYFKSIGEKLNPALSDVEKIIIGILVVLFAITIILHIFRSREQD